MTRAKIFLPLLLLVVLGGYIIQQRFSDSVSFQASVDSLTTNSTVSIGSDTYIVELATTPIEKSQGLADRDTLGTDAGMLFVFSPAEQPAFWMRDMRFSIDIVWIKNQKIIGLEKNLPVPNPKTALENLSNYPAPDLVDYVLEINAGRAANYRVGDSVVIGNPEST